MPQNITDVDTWTTPLVDLADGDVIDGAAFLAAQQGVGNRTAFLRARQLGAVAGSILRQPLVMMHNDASRFAYTDSLAAAQGLIQTSIASTGRVMLACPHLPQIAVGNHTLIAAIVNFTGGSGHAGLPATMPHIDLYGQAFAGGAPTLLGSADDTSASVVIYEALHAVSITGLTTPLENYETYYLAILGEASTNASTGLLVTSAALYVDPA